MLMTHRARTFMCAAIAIGTTLLPMSVGAQNVICPETGSIYLTHTNRDGERHTYAGEVGMPVLSGGTCTYTFYALATDVGGISVPYIQGTADASTWAIIAAQDMGLVPVLNYQVDDEGTTLNGVDDPWLPGGPGEDPSGGGPKFYAVIESRFTLREVLV